MTGTDLLALIVLVTTAIALVTFVRHDRFTYEPALRDLIRRQPNWPIDV